MKQEGVEELLPEGWQLVADELSEHANFSSTSFRLVQWLRKLCGEVSKRLREMAVDVSSSSCDMIRLPETTKESVFIHDCCFFLVLTAKVRKTSETKKLFSKINAEWPLIRGKSASQDESIYKKMCKNNRQFNFLLINIQIYK